MVVPRMRVMMLKKVDTRSMRLAPTAFQAAKHSQLRGYMSDLGLTDLRKRPAAEDQEKDEHFDD